MNRSRHDPVCADRCSAKHLASRLPPQPDPPGDLARFHRELDEDYLYVLRGALSHPA